MIGRILIYLLALAGGTVFLFAYRLWFAGFLMAALLGLPLFSLILSLPAMITTRLSPQVPETMEQDTQVCLELAYSSVLPTPPFRCRIRVERPLTGQRWSLRPESLLPADRCGGLVVTIHRAWVYDYLKLFPLPVRRCPPRTVVVRPRPVPMAVPDPALLAPAWKPKPGGGFAENHELRLYRPGDSLQAIHWKLTAKTGKLMIREAMEPVSRPLSVQLELTGDPDTLERKLGRLLWLGDYLTQRQLSFQLQALTGRGVEVWSIPDHEALLAALDALLLSPPATGGSLAERMTAGAWNCPIGGEPDEA